MKSPAITPLTNKALSFVKEHKLALGVAAVGAIAISVGLLALACVGRSEWAKSFFRTDFESENKKLYDLIDKGDFKSCFDELKRLKTLKPKINGDNSQLQGSIFNTVVFANSNKGKLTIAHALIARMAAEPQLTDDQKAKAVECLDEIIKENRFCMVAFDVSGLDIASLFMYAVKLGAEEAMKCMLNCLAQPDGTEDREVVLPKIKRFLIGVAQLGSKEYANKSLQDILEAACFCQNFESLNYQFLNFLQNYDFSKIEK